MGCRGWDSNQNRVRTLIDNYLAEVEPLLVSPPPPIADAQFDHLARALFTAQFEQVAPYRNLCLARGITPHSLPHWSAMPAVPTRAFKEFDWTSLAPDERSRVFHSSGTTTETPSRHFHDPASLHLYELSILAWAPAWLFPHDRDRLDLLFLTPPPRAVPHSSLVHMFETLRQHWDTANSLFAGCCDAAGQWTLSPEAMRRTLGRAEATARPLAILGTAFSFVEMLEQLEADATRYSLPPRSRILETGGYKGRSRVLPKPELYRRLSETLGVSASSILSEYGMCELSSQAYDHAAGAPDLERTFRFPPWARALVIDPHSNAPAAAGETGLLRVVDLANVRSVLALQTEDLAYAQNAGFALVGRTTDAAARGCSLLSP